jgi:membrane-associated protease RseP (regulator of RpoE activity)
MNKDFRRALIQIALFVTTFITTTLAGSSWINGKSPFYGEYGWNDFVSGMSFSIPFLLILTVHEFGHYFTAMYHRVKATLPYYIPLPPFPFMIGTLGAVIRLKQIVPSKKQNFDIGLAGPLAGFIVALVVLWYGFATLPPAEYIFTIHPEYKQYGVDYAARAYESKPNVLDITIGKNLLFVLFEKFVADPSRVPNVHEIMHYPVIFGGYLALVFTFMNLMPVGQLDGGHVLYGLAGFKKHRAIASVFYVAFMFYAGLGNEYIDPSKPFNELVLWIAGYGLFLYFAFTGLKLSMRNTVMYALLILTAQFLLALYFPTMHGYQGWLLFGFLVGKIVGVPHPPCEIEEPLDAKRIAMGWLALLFFILCFSPAPLQIN